MTEYIAQKIEIVLTQSYEGFWLARSGREHGEVTTTPEQALLTLVRKLPKEATNNPATILQDD